MSGSEANQLLKYWTAYNDKMSQFDQACLSYVNAKQTQRWWSFTMQIWVLKDVLSISLSIEETISYTDLVNTIATIASIVYNCVLVN